MQSSFLQAWSTRSGKQGEATVILQAVHYQFKQLRILPKVILSFRD
jgi:hypothetical protein